MALEDHGTATATDVELAPLNASTEQRTAEAATDKAISQVEGWPLWVVPALVFGIVAASSSGVTVALIDDVPAFRLGGWRHQITATLLSPVCVIQYRNLAPDLRMKVWRNVPMLCFSGVFLAARSSFWIWGIKHTSLIHAYLYAGFSPLAIALYTLMLRKPISVGELVGTVIGVAGAVVLALGPSVQDAHVWGDLAALASAVAFIGYLETGRSLRSWMPLMVYAAPVTGCAAVIMSLLAFAFEHDSTLNGELVIGYIGGHHALAVAYLGIIPGIIGHQGLNAAVKHVPPLAIALASAAEPIIGSLIGFALHVVGAPTIHMAIGGAFIVGGTVATVWSAHHRHTREAEKKSDDPEEGVQLREESDESMPA